MDIEQMKKELAELRAYKEAAEKQEPEPYDAGFLNDFGGGNVSWWHDYIRAELDRAHDHYAQQFTVTADKPVTRQDVIDVLLSTRGQSEGVTADAILGLLSDRGAATVPDAMQLLQRVSASTKDKPDHWAVMSPGRADQYRAESIAVRKELGFSADSDEVAPIDLLNAIHQIRADRSRITEQDAREIAESVVGYVGRGNVDYWFRDFGGRELLNKLNADREQVPAVAKAIELLKVAERLFRSLNHDPDRELQSKECRRVIADLEIIAPPSHSQQGASTDDLAQRLLGRAEFLRDRGEIKTPELLERAANAIR